MTHAHGCDGHAAYYRKLLTAVRTKVLAADEIVLHASFLLASVCDQCVRSLLATTPPDVTTAFRKYFADHIAPAQYMPSTATLLPPGSTQEARQALMRRLTPRLLMIHQALTENG